VFATCKAFWRFRDPTKIQFFQPAAGKVFQVRVNTLGPGHRDTKLDVNLEEWQKCTECEEYRNCLDFCMASLAFKEAVARI
jgi:hypothetical protein